MITVNKLHVLSARLTRITSDINHGGCCVMAGIIAPYLSNFCQVRIRVLDRYGSRPNLNQVASNLSPTSKLRDWGMNDVFFNHVVLELIIDGEKYFYDTDRLKTAKQFYNMKNRPMLHPGHLEVHNAVKLGNEPNWNRDFPRETIPLLQRVVHQFFTTSVHFDEDRLVYGEKVMSRQSDLIDV
jgi:hypothetical protein